jgi:dephospho-CoA kinase
MLKKRRIVIGVTGSLGSGKTTVSRLFGALGAKVINADKIVNVIYRDKPSIVRKIAQIFGKEVLTKAGKLNRRVLSKKAFSHKSYLKKLNRIIHPLVINKIKQEINKSHGVIIVDVPLLIESNLHRSVDYIVLLNTNLKLQIQRVLEKSQISELEMRRRIAAQLPFKDKKRFADFIINNNSSIENLKKQVKQIFQGVAKWILK